MNKQRLEANGFLKRSLGLLTLSASVLLVNETNLTSRDAKARINYCGMDTNEEVQDRCSG
jgi:hypothetical protein